MNELINYEAVYRTAPATPGLLNILIDCFFVDNLNKFFFSYRYATRILCTKFAKNSDGYSYNGISLFYGI